MAEAREPLLQSFDKEPLGDHESLSPPPYHSPPKRKRFADGLPLALLESLAVLALGASTAAICIWYFCYGISNPTVPDQTNTLTSCPCTDALPIKAPRPSTSRFFNEPDEPVELDGPKLTASRPLDESQRRGGHGPSIVAHGARERPQPDLVQRSAGHVGLNLTACLVSG
jgi:hypothetical protein